MDFHTSEHIAGVGSRFDPHEFAGALRRAGADGCLAKARCHHGWCYYPTEIGEPHPHLECPDLVGGIIGAARSVGVSPMLYITVGWDEKTARERPEWRQRHPDGTHVGAPDGEPGWRNICLNTPYADFVEELWRELLGRYDFDRVFFDIVMYGEDGCSCEWCLAGMRREGLDPDSRADRRRYAFGSRERFMGRMTAAGAAAKPDVPLYYNNPWHVSAHPEACADRFLRHQQFMCIESLPSGFWGYDHFPFQACYYGHKGLDIYSHTGRFHTAWGDFGGLKNPAALEYECLRHAAYGIKTAVGDQLHPSGAIEPYTAELLAGAFAKLKPWQELLLGAEPVYEVGILVGTGTDPDAPFETDNVPETGAMRMLLERQTPFRLFDGFEADWPVRLMILPDHVHLDDERKAKVRRFIASGGKVIASGVSGVGLEEWPVEGIEPYPFQPAYLHPAGEGLLWDYHFALYQRSWRVKARPGARVLAVLAEPYFNRTAEHFCSHRHAPVRGDTAAPAVCVNDSVAYVANDVFRGYRRNGYAVYKRLVHELMDRLLPDPLVRTNCPTTAELTLRRRDDSLLICLLHYCPQRRGQDIDIVEDAQALAGVSLGLRVEGRPQAVTLEPEGVELEWEWSDGYARVQLPLVRGSAVVMLHGAGSG
ncbi:MAG: hypothetical protein AMK73_07590 [Planctomycetes bacterium SM23_32]|nr:MAG: hypothetical protein AMK73_07590 [Planctomycetes bacterium SM23_32]